MKPTILKGPALAALYCVLMATASQAQPQPVAEFGTPRGRLRPAPDQGCPRRWPAACPGRLGSPVPTQLLHVSFLGLPLLAHRSVAGVASAPRFPHGPGGAAWFGQVDLDQPGLSLVGSPPSARVLHPAHQRHRASQYAWEIVVRGKCFVQQRRRFFTARSKAVKSGNKPHPGRRWAVEMHNVLLVANKLQLIQDMLQTREVVGGV